MWNYTVMAILIICSMIFGMVLMALFIANDDRMCHCPECKYYYAPVCTFYKWLPMVSRRGYCYHAKRGKYEGETPKIAEGGLYEDNKDKDS